MKPFYGSPIAHLAGRSLLPNSVEAIPVLELHARGRVSTAPPFSAATRVSAGSTAVSDDPPPHKIKLASEEQVQITVLGPD